MSAAVGSSDRTTHDSVASPARRPVHARINMDVTPTKQRFDDGGDRGMHPSAPSSDDEMAVTRSRSAHALHSRYTHQMLQTAATRIATRIARQIVEATRTEAIARHGACVVIQRAFRQHLDRERRHGCQWWRRAYERSRWAAMGSGSGSGSAALLSNHHHHHQPRHPLPFPVDFLPTRREIASGVLPSNYAFEPRRDGRWTVDPFRLRQYPAVPDGQREDRGDYTTQEGVRHRCWDLLKNFDASQELRGFLVSATKSDPWSSDRSATWPRQWADTFRSDAYGNVVAIECGGGKSITAFAVDHIFPVSRGGRNSALNTMALQWGANGYKSDAIINRIAEGSTENDELSCGLQVTDLIALGRAVHGGEVDATWNEIDRLIRRQPLPACGNKRSFQAQLAAAAAVDTALPGSHGTRVWATLCQIKQDRERNSVWFREGTWEADWRDARVADNLPTHIRILRDRAQLECGEVYPARGWKLDDKKPAAWVGTSQQRFEIARYFPGCPGLAKVLWGRCASEPSVLSAEPYWEWCEAPAA